MQAWRQMNFDPRRKPDDLKVEPLPDFLAYLWQHYNQLTSKRSYNESGPNSISWSDIDAWCRVNKLNLLKWELELIAALDTAFIGVWYEK